MSIMRLCVVSIIMSLTYGCKTPREEKRESIIIYGKFMENDVQNMIAFLCEKDYLEDNHIVYILAIGKEYEVQTAKNALVLTKQQDTWKVQKYDWISSSLASVDESGNVEIPPKLKEYSIRVPLCR